MECGRDDQRITLTQPPRVPKTTTNTIDAESSLPYLTIHFPKSKCYLYEEDDDIHSVAREPYHTEREQNSRQLMTGADGSGVSATEGEVGHIKTILSAQACKFLDELLRNYNYETRSTQSISPPRDSHSHLNGISAMRTEALYIFNPQHQSFACFMYRSDGGGAENEYSFEHVPVRIVHGLGSSAYFVAMSPRDKTGSSLPQVSAVRSEAGPASAYHDHNRERDTEDVAFGTTEEIINRVRHHLRTAVQYHNVFAPGGLNERDVEGGALYLFSDKDIADAIALACESLQPMKHAIQ